MAVIIQNNQEYDKKLPTNIRLVGRLKDLAISEARHKNVSLAKIVNESLAARYNVSEEDAEDERSDTESDLG